MLYNPKTGKRVKKPNNHISWAHTSLKLSEFKLRQCFFGEHLLKDKTKPVAIVESEKTAIIASIYLPKFLWLACGSFTNLSYIKCKLLQERKAVLFPDIKGFDKWNSKAKEFGFQISDLLECRANKAERENGLDLADYLIRFDYRDFNKGYYQETSIQNEQNNPKNKPHLLQNRLINLLYRMEQSFLQSPNGKGLRNYELAFINIVELNHCESLVEHLALRYTPNYCNAFWH